MSTPQCEKLALNATEAAAILGVSRPTIYKLMRSEGFPVFSIGQRRLISRAGLVEWIQRQTEAQA